MFFQIHVHGLNDQPIEVRRIAGNFIKRHRIDLISDFGQTRYPILFHRVGCVENQNSFLLFHCHFSLLELFKIAPVEQYAEGRIFLSSDLCVDRRSVARRNDPGDDRFHLKFSGLD